MPLNIASSPRLDEVPFPHFVVLQYDYLQPLMRHTNGDPQL
jgi:hypothetical protein